MAYRRKTQPRKRMKLFFKAKEGKNGAEYWEAKSRTGVSAQLFKADKNDIEFTMSISMPAPKRRATKRRNSSPGASQMQQLKDQNALLMTALIKR